MKFLTLLLKEKNKKRRDITRREQDVLSAHAREQFKKLIDWGLPISVSV